MPLRNLFALILLAITAMAGSTAAESCEARSAFRGEKEASPLSLRAGAARRSSEEAVIWLKSRGLYDALRARLEGERYRVRSRKEAEPARPDDSYEASNPEQGFVARFAGGGIELAPGAKAAPGWRWGMRLAGYGYGGRREPLPSAEASGSGNRVEYRYGPHLTEWYVNTSRGIEQGFTLDAAPRSGATATGPLELTLAVTGDLAPRAAGDVVQFVSADGEAVLGYRELHAWDARGRGLPSHMAVDGALVRLVIDDREAEYPVTVDPLVFQVATLTPTGGLPDDEFGWWVAISGDTAVVGAPGRETQPGGSNGAVFVFVLTAAGWTQQEELTAPDGLNLDSFGAAVAISGNTLVVGAPGHDPGGKPDAGAAYVFVRNGTSWTASPPVKLVPSNVVAGDGFGQAVAISGDVIVVGAPHSGSGGAAAGQAYIFVRSGGSWTQWTQTKTLTGGTAAAPGDAFGYAVAISDSGSVKTVAVGAPFFPAPPAGVGLVHVFDGSGTNWAQTNLGSFDGECGDAFGLSVSVSGNTVVVGAPGHDPGSGAKPMSGQAYVFVRSGTGPWTIRARLKASDRVARDFFGAAVDIDGDTVVVGAPGRNTGAGRAYVFTRSVTAWSQQAILTAINPGPQQFFGFAAAISAGRIVVGAPFRDVVGPGAPAGPAYVFSPSP